MAAPTLTQLRTGLVANLASLTGITVSPYMLANPTPPTIHLYPGGPAGDIDYDLANARGLDKWPFTVQAFVSVTIDLSAQANLDAFLAPTGATSIKQLLEADQTLGGVAGVQAVNVVTASGYRIFVPEGRPPVLGAEWRVEVLAIGH